MISLFEKEVEEARRCLCSAILSFSAVLLFGTAIGLPLDAVARLRQNLVACGQSLGWPEHSVGETGHCRQV